MYKKIKQITDFKKSTKVEEKQIKKQDKPEKREDKLILLSRVTMKEELDSMMQKVRKNKNKAIFDRYRKSKIKDVVYKVDFKKQEDIMDKLPINNVFLNDIDLVDDSGGVYELVRQRMDEELSYDSEDLNHPNHKNNDYPSTPSYTDSEKLSDDLSASAESDSEDEIDDAQFKKLFAKLKLSKKERDEFDEDSEPYYIDI